jgi:hypothetical protein
MLFGFAFLESFDQGRTLARVLFGFARFFSADRSPEIDHQSFDQAGITLRERSLVIGF